MRAPSARAAGMAEAYSALGADRGGIAAYAYNPAASAFLPGSELSFLGQRGVAEDNYGSLFFGHPTGIGTFAGHFLYYSVGDIELINTQGVSRTVRAQQDLLAGLNYADRIFEYYSTGVSVKYLNSKLLDSLSANSVSVDLGLQARFMDEKLSFGLSASHLGNGLGYLNSTEALPLTLRAGGSYLYRFTENGKGLFALDAVQVKDEKLREHIGFEYLWSELLALRAGYKIGQGEGRLSFGIGFLYGRYGLDYALSDQGDLGQQHAFSIGIQFGAERSQEKAVSRRIRDTQRRQGNGRAMPSARNSKPTLLFLDVAPVSANDREAQDISELMRIAFQERGHNLLLIPRSEMERALHLSRSPRCSELACALDVGQQAGADKVLIGALSNLGNIYILKIRMIDVSSAAVEYSETTESYSVEELKRTARRITDKLISIVR